MNTDPNDPLNRYWTKAWEEERAREPSIARMMRADQEDELVYGLDAGGTLPLDSATMAQRTADLFANARWADTLAGRTDSIGAQISAASEAMMDAFAPLAAAVGQGVRDFMVTLERLAAQDGASPEQFYRALLDAAATELAEQEHQYFEVVHDPSAKREARNREARDLAYERRAAARKGWERGSATYSRVPRAARVQQHARANAGSNRGRRTRT